MLRIYNKWGEFVTFKFCLCIYLLGTGTNRMSAVRLMNNVLGN